MKKVRPPQPDSVQATLAEAQRSQKQALAAAMPDLIAVKPEPKNGMPQAASAHDTWDFAPLMPETTHTPARARSACRASWAPLRQAAS